MKIKRIDSDRTEKEVERIEIEVNGVKYTITARFNEMKIHGHCEELVIKPCCANEVVVSGHLR